MEFRPVNSSSHWAFFLLFASAWFISVSGISLWKIDSLLHTSSAFSSLLSLPRHTCLILPTDESKQEGYSRASKCCAVETILLSTVPGTRTIFLVQYLVESLCWLHSPASLASSSWNVAIPLGRVGQGREKRLGQYGMLVLLGFL